MGGGAVTGFGAIACIISKSWRCMVSSVFASNGAPAIGAAGGIGGAAYAVGICAYGGAYGGG